MVFEAAGSARGCCNPESMEAFTADAAMFHIVENPFTARRSFACGRGSHQDGWRLLPQAGESRQCMRIRKTGKGHFCRKDVSIGCDIGSFYTRK